MSIFALAIFNLIFFWKFYHNPYLLCTSELASTYFPHWIWMGKKLREGIFPAIDSIYYLRPASIPFLSMFYPPNLLAAWLGSFFNLDRAFRLYAYFILFHYFICSLFAYYLFGNLFCAITLAYAGYCIKLQTPAFVYSLTWFPLALKGSSIGWMMSLLGGYYPILVYVAPILLLLKPLTFILGIFLAVPQLIPFLGYFKKSIRMTENFDKKIGSIPLLKLKDLFIPNSNYQTINQIHYPEMSMYMGIAILFIWRASWWWVPLTVGIFIGCGIICPFQRIPARILYLISVSVSFLAVIEVQQFHLSPQQELSIVLLTAFLLLRNSSIYPSFPFSQWWDKPSKLYNKRPKLNNWPFITGYLKDQQTSEYLGAFRLRH